MKFILASLLATLPLVAQTNTNSAPASAPVSDSSETGNPADQAMYSPSTPSDRQPVPYWYFGPSFCRITSASVE